MTEQKTNIEDKCTKHTQLKYDQINQLTTKIWKADATNWANSPLSVTFGHSVKHLLGFNKLPTKYEAEKNFEQPAMRINWPMTENGDAHPSLSSRTEPTLPVNIVLCSRMHCTTKFIRKNDTRGTDKTWLKSIHILQICCKTENVTVSTKPACEYALWKPNAFHMWNALKWWKQYLWNNVKHGWRTNPMWVPDVAKLRLKARSTASTRRESRLFRDGKCTPTATCSR